MPSLPRTFRPSHLPAQPRRAEKDFDARRGSASSRGYTHRWTKAAEGHRRRHPLCVGCEAEGLVTAAELVDHVEPHKGDTAKFWNKAMWQSSCRWHHDVIKQRLEQMWATGEIATADLWLNSRVAVKLSRELRP